MGSEEELGEELGEEAEEEEEQQQLLLLLLGSETELPELPTDGARPL